MQAPRYSNRKRTRTQGNGRAGPGAGELTCTASEAALRRSPPQREGPRAGDSPGERAGERECAREPGGWAREAMERAATGRRSAASAVAMEAERQRLPAPRVRPSRAALRLSKHVIEIQTYQKSLAAGVADINLCFH